MQITSSKSDILAALAPVSASTSRDKTDPMKACVLIEARDTASFTGTDMLLTVSMDVGATVNLPGDLCVPAGSFQKIISTFPAGGIVLRKLDGNYLEIKSTAPKSKVTVKIQGYPAASFPLRDVVPDGGEVVRFPAAHLRRLLDAAMYAVCGEESRVNICCVHIDRSKPVVSVVTTDGHRMAHASMPLAFPELLKSGEALPQRETIDLPRRSATVLASYLTEGADCAMRVAGKFAVFQVGAMRAVVKTADVVFPPWQTIFPVEHKHTCRIPRRELQAMVDRALAMAESRSHMAKFTFTAGAAGSGEVSLTADNPDMGVLHDALDKGITMDAGAVVSSMNAAYIHEAIAHLPGDTIVFKLNSSNEVSLITSEGADTADGFTSRALVMPMTST
jgi:DNA polymerase-3 subunit beta